MTYMSHWRRLERAETRQQYQPIPDVAASRPCGRMRCTWRTASLQRRDKRRETLVDLLVHAEDMARAGHNRNRPNQFATKCSNPKRCSPLQNPAKCFKMLRDASNCSVTKCFGMLRNVSF